MRLNRARITSVTDALHFARKRLPPGVMQQFESGAGLLQTHDANVHAFESVMFRPRHGVYVPERDQSTTVLGHRLRTPLYAASIGLLGVGNADWEIGVARRLAMPGDTVRVCCLLLND